MNPQVREQLNKRFIVKKWFMEETKTLANEKQKAYTKHRLW